MTEQPREQHTPDTGEAPSRTRRAGRWLATSRTTLVLAAGFVVVVLVAALGILAARVFDSGGADTATAPAIETATAPPAAATPTVPGELFGPPSADRLGRPVANPINPAGQPLPQQPVDRAAYGCPAPPACPPVQTPAGMMWQNIGPWTLPFSTSDGPSRIDGPLAFGYTHTPQGAALAAWQIIWRSATSRDSWEAAKAQQIVSDPDQDLTTDQQWDASAVPAAVPHPSAFRVTGWTPDASFAVVQYAIPDREPGTWFTMQLEAVWQDGDWKLRAPDVAPPQVTLVILDGWSPW